MTSTQRAWTGYGGTISFGRIAGIFIGLLALWRERSRQRRALKKLDDRLLRDIGIGSIEAGNEARKWFWQA